MLEIKDLHKTFNIGTINEKVALDGVNLNLNSGDFVTIIGGNGAGKSTTLNAIAGVWPVDQGKVIVDGVDITRLSEHKRAVHLGRVFQDPMTALNPVISVGDQISEVIRLHEKIYRKDAEVKAIQMLEMVGIPGERYDDYPHQFSGGMKQRVVIAIALACNPELLIADEPTTALDVTIQEQVLDLIENLKKEFNTTLILITHDLGVVAEVCEKAAIMYAGEIVEYGTLEHIYNNTKHPYTIGLFGSIPNFNENVRRLKPIMGLMPDPANLPEGCVFAERCSEATEKCRHGHIPTVEIEPGHLVKCLKFVKEGE